MCLHEIKKWVKDTPIANPETLEFEGRFDTLYCVYCGEILDSVPVGTSI